MLPHAVVALEHAETPQRCGDADRGEAGVAGRRIWPAVVHRRADHHAGRHLVVKQPADFVAKDGFQFTVKAVFQALGMAVNAANQLAFKMHEGSLKFTGILADDGQCGIAKRFTLQAERVGQELSAGGTKQGVLMTEPGTTAGLSAGK